MKTRLITLISSTLLGVAGITASSIYYFWEPRGFSQSSLAYLLKVDAQISQFPIWSKVTAPIYSIGNAEGLKPYTVEINYRSRLTMNQLQANAEEQGLTCESRQDFIFCEKDNFRNFSVSIIISDHGSDHDTRELHLTFLGGSHE